VAVRGCNVSTPGANGTLYGRSDLDNAVRGMYQERESVRYRKNPQSRRFYDLKSANKTAAGKIVVGKQKNRN